MKKLILPLVWPLISFGQVNPGIGDMMPRIAVKNIYNYKSSSLRLSDLKGKLLILDFFSTWCTACIKSLPALDSLQNRFAQKLQVIIIAGEPLEKIEAFRKKNKIFQSIHLPVVTGDTILNKLFPHKLIPHEVWIDAGGIIKAITGDEEITEINVAAMIAGKDLNLPLKKDIMDFDYHKPLIADGNGGDETNLLYRSLWAGRLPGLPSGEGHTKNSNTVRHYFINHTALTLYWQALHFISNRVILELKDADRYIYSPGVSEYWKDTNLYTYELTIPARASKKEFQSLMISDLNRYLHLSGSMELRTIKCYALVRHSNNSLLNTKGLKPSLNLIDSLGLWQFVNQPLSEIITILNNVNAPSPGKPIILDETGFTGNIDIEIPDSVMYNPFLLKEFLYKYGLSLIPVERQIEMFVLKNQ
jgi:thiol-disulfide isomerase/thioredoxin